MFLHNHWPCLWSFRKTLIRLFVARMYKSALKILSLFVIRAEYIEYKQLKSEGQGEIGQVTKVVKNLVKNEGFLRGFSRGLYARMLQSSCTSVFIILGYEYVKKLSLKEEQIEKFEIWLLGNLAPDFEGTIFLAFVFLGAVKKLNNVWRWTCWLRECRKQYFLHMNGGTYIL